MANDQATNGMDKVNFIINETYRVIEDYLRTMGADQSVIDFVKTNAKIKGQIGYLNSRPSS